MKEEKHVTKLSTSSPEAIKVALEITSTRLANLLIRKGPLPIRSITGQLSVEVPGFEMLSLSKQRRLIMAAMDQIDPENNVVFEKIGWGQWAVRKVDLDYIVIEGSEKGGDSGFIDGNAADTRPRLSVHELKEKAKLGWSKKADKSLKPTSRRDSISNQKSNLHNMEVPEEKLSTEAILSESDSELPSGDEIDDNAIAEDSDEDDDAMFAFDHDDQRNPYPNRHYHQRKSPMTFANRVPLKVSPPPHPGTRRKSSSSTGQPSGSVSKHTTHPNRHHFFNRSRLNSTENFDNYLVSSARTSSVSVSSPPPNQIHNNIHLHTTHSASPIGSWTGGSPNFLAPGSFNVSSDHIANALTSAGRRKLSFNESSIRSTLSSSLPKSSTHSRVLLPPADSSVDPSTVKSTASDTDEEDWATIGAESLRKHTSSNHRPGKSNHRPGKSNQDENQAARALVDLMSI